MPFHKNPHKIYFLLAVLLCCLGCDAVYRLLQKEGAEEKQLIGEIIPLESNPKVQEVQQLLKLYGYAIGNVDGMMGANTRKAVEDFQKDNDLKPTRFVDYATWERLHVFEDYDLVVAGVINIASVQKALKAAGLDPGPVDGRPGRKTQESIILFQKQSQLKPDGKIGFKTLWALAGHLPRKQDDASARQ